MCRLIGSLTPLFLLCALTGCYTRLRPPEPPHSDAPVPPVVQEDLQPLPARPDGSFYSGLFPARCYDPWDALPYHTHYNRWTGRLTFPASYHLIRTPHGYLATFYNPRVKVPVAPGPRIRRRTGELHPEAKVAPVAPRPRIRRRGFVPEVSSVPAVRGQNTVTSPKESKPSEGKQPEKKKKPSEEEKREKKRKKNRRRGGMN